MSFDCIYGFDMLELREICLFQWYLSLRKIAVKGGAGGLRCIHVHWNHVPLSFLIQT